MLCLCRYREMCFQNRDLDWILKPTYYLTWNYLNWKKKKTYFLSNILSTFSCLVWTMEVRPCLRVGLGATLKGNESVVLFVSLFSCLVVLAKKCSWTEGAEDSHQPYVLRTDTGEGSKVRSIERSRGSYEVWGLCYLGTCGEQSKGLQIEVRVYKPEK